jgi:hypothetical protein
MIRCKPSISNGHNVRSFDDPDPLLDIPMTKRKPQPPDLRETQQQMVERLSAKLSDGTLGPLSGTET